MSAGCLFILLPILRDALEHQAVLWVRRNSLRLGQQTVIPTLPVTYILRCLFTWSIKHLSGCRYRWSANLSLYCDKTNLIKKALVVIARCLPSERLSILYVLIHVLVLNLVSWSYESYLDEWAATVDPSYSQKVIDH